MLKFTKYAAATSVVLLTLTTGCSRLDRLQGKSSASKIALAKHLKETGAILYSSPWCPYCNEQKKVLGKEAFSQLNVVDCEGKKAQLDLCQKANIKHIPTWEIKGQQYGGMSLEELAEVSDYKGDRKF